MNKKKILSAAFAAVLIVAVVFGYSNKTNDTTGLSDFALQNVEALATGESGSKMVGYPCKNPNDGVGCGDIGQTGPPCDIKRYC